jgi:LPS-assembly protein
MLPGNRLGITAVVVCHLVLAPRLLTSQLPPRPAPPATSHVCQFPASEATTTPSASGGETVTLCAQQQEKQADLYTLRGEVEIHYRDLVLRADEVTYNSQTSEATATGHLSLDGGPNDEHVEASRGSYNLQNQTGVLYDVLGTTGVLLRGRRLTLTTSTPFTFSGKKVEQTGPDRYVLYHGWVTACELPRPKWSFNAEKIVVNIGGEARIFNSTFRVEKVPILYLPFAQHPVENLGRSSGFLIPTFGTSSIKGLILGDSVYLATSRSSDVTLGAEYFSKRGWAQSGTARWRPNEDSYVKLNYYGVMDRLRQGGEDATLDAETRLRYGFRGVASLEYLSSFVFRLAFFDNFSQTVNSEVSSNLFASKTYNGFSFNALFNRYQNFQSTTPGDVVTIVHLPTFDFSSVERQLAATPLYWSFDTAAEGLSRKEPGFVTGNLVGRYDLHPRVSLPVLFRGWTLRPELAARETFYTEHLNPASTTIVPPNSSAGGVNRKALEVGFELRPPALARVFDRELFGRKIKHTLEPRFVYHYVTGVDNFFNVIRFDARDILSNSNDVEYAVVQRLYGKRADASPCELSATAFAAQRTLPHGTPTVPAVTPEGQSRCAHRGARELIAWELKQKYFFDPSFGGALVNGQRNVFTTTEEFTGLAFLTAPRRFSPIVSRLQVHSSANTDITWQLDYDTGMGRINGSTTALNYRFGNIFAQASHAYLLTAAELATSVINPVAGLVPAPSKFNQYRLLLGYGSPNKRGLNAAMNVGYDANLNFLQYSAVQTSYNWDCCGLSVEYRRYVLAPVRNENQYRFAFTLANIGTFGNMKRQERIF